MSEDVDRFGGVLLDTRRIPTIKERSDVDHHENLGPGYSRRLAPDAEYWGEGFFVQEEPVLVQRGPDGTIARTTPLSQVPGVELDAEGGDELRDDEVLEAEPLQVLRPLPTSRREKLAFILAKRMMDWYVERLMANPMELNPLRDGIPVCRDHPAPTGCTFGCKGAEQGVSRYNASPGEVFEWVKGVVARRIKLINKKQNRRGYAGDIHDIALRVTRDPIR